MTLAQLAAMIQTHTPMMHQAIKRAMACHELSAKCAITSGLPTYRKGSNFYNAAQSIGANGAHYSYYLGPHNRRGTEGWKAVIVVNAPETAEVTE